MAMCWPEGSTPVERFQQEFPETNDGRPLTTSQSGRLHRFRSSSELRDITITGRLPAAEEAAATFPAELKKLIGVWDDPPGVLEHLFHRQLETTVLLS